MIRGCWQGQPQQREALFKIAVVLSAAKDLGEPRDASRTLRRNNCAFGLPSIRTDFTTCTNW
jgi:hypothetical protein